MKKFWLILLAVFACISGAEAAGLQAEVDRNILPQGETFVLSIKYDGGKTNQQPDFSVLEKDFSIFSMGTSFQHNYINGKISQSQEWQLVLMPRATGKIEIPSVSLGNKTSNPVQIEVIPATAQNMQKEVSSPQKPRFAIEAEIDNKNPYVQQEVNVMLKLYDTGGMQIERVVPLNLNENDWVVRSMGSPELESTVINGRSTRVIKLGYALFPQRSGRLTIPAFAAEGFYLTRSKNPMRQIFDDAFGPMGMSAGFDDVFATKNPVSVATEPVQIEVKPIPSQSRGAWWIPAEKVELFSEWKPNPPQFKVGEAVTRNIYLKAVGVIDNQLPSIDFKDSGSLRQYPEKPVTEMKLEGDKIASLRMISTVYIPSEAGQAQVPEVKVNWFNVKTGQNETAVLPAMTVNVLPNAALAEAEKEAAAEKVSPTKVKATETQPVQAAETHLNKKSDEAIEQSRLRKEQHAGYDKYVWMVVAFLAGIIITYLLLSRKRGSSEQEDVLSVRDYAKLVVRSAKAKDLKKLRDNLILWSRQYSGREDITNLNDVAQALNQPEMSRLLDEISEKLYNPSTTVWDNTAFIACFEKLSRHSKSGSHAEDKRLPDLYD